MWDTVDYFIQPDDGEVLYQPTPDLFEDIVGGPRQAVNRSWHDDLIAMKASTSEFDSSGSQGQNEARHSSWEKKSNTRLG